jgi:predicted O-linked N-acetylglucosamine transferase (SPINDLY family)
VPGSTLLLKSRGLSIREVRERVLSWFAKSIARERISILDLAANSSDGLRDYARADIALDPFPYNGTTTTCEALSAGVPLIALRGETHAGRVSASILESIGERALVADSELDYVKLAVELARDPARLAKLRSELPARFASAPVGDPARLARDLERALRFAWSEFVESSPAAC